MNKFTKKIYFLSNLFFFYPHFLCLYCFQEYYNLPEDSASARNRYRRKINYLENKSTWGPIHFNIYKMHACLCVGLHTKAKKKKNQLIYLER